ncbi:MAG: hypothetical protein ACR2HB_03120 [Dehalococcoidia bacterium]
MCRSLPRRRSFSSLVAPIARDRLQGQPCKILRDTRQPLKPGPHRGQSLYSGPCRSVGQSLRLALVTNRPLVWEQEALVAQHARRYQDGQLILELAHYLPALARKPRGAAHAAVVGQMPPSYASVRQRLGAAQRDGYREFAAILVLHQAFAADDVQRALEEAWERDCRQASAVRQLLRNQTATPPPAPLPLPDSLAEASVPTPDLAHYALLLTGVS